MLFWKKKAPLDLDALVQEKWKTNFAMFSKIRFTVDTYDTYASYKTNGKYHLKLLKSNLFAWVINPYFQYDDFCLEAEIGFSQSNPYSAVGFVFRYINDENFYYFLISDKGYFRFDLVFNGNPIPFIPWTKLPFSTGETNSLMIIANDTRFSFYSGNEWIAEMEDETIIAGRIGLAAQNFDEGDAADFYMSEFSIESRPVEVQRLYNRWIDYVPVNPENRITLAKSFFAMGNFTAAAIQMKKVLKHKKPAVEDCLFFAETLINSGIYDVALEYIEKALALDNRKKEALQEKANLLYLQNRFIEARDYINSILLVMENNAALMNLLGNCEYSLGNWDRAADAYLKAFELDSGIPLFLVNAARALEMDKKADDALRKYLAASKLLFQQEAYGDLYNILSRVTALDPQNRDVIALSAKMLFHEHKISEAKVHIASLISSGYEDSAIYYLAGLIKIDEQDRKTANAYLEKACALEPDFYLNWYKLAENRYFLGYDPEKELIRVTELAPDYPWAINLFGLLYQHKGNLEEAVAYFKRAYKLAPGELDILINLSEALFKIGEKIAAFELIDGYEREDAWLYNHKGNLLAMNERFEDAVHEYERALWLDPDNPVFMENLASSCIELDMLMRAEELLIKLYDTNPTASVLNLVGNLSLMKGEYVRAEIAFKEALSLEPDNLNVKCNLASLLLTRQDYRKAKEVVQMLLKAYPDSSQVQTLHQRMRKQFETQYNCSTCSRVWWVPREVPLHSTLKLYDEPPGEAPAGKCVTCGKVYCINCARHYLKEDRFTCPDCGAFLKLSEDWIKYALLEIMEQEKTAGGNTAW